MTRRASTGVLIALTGTGIVFAAVIVFTGIGKLLTWVAGF